MNATDERTFLDPNFMSYLVQQGESFNDVLSQLQKSFPKLCTDVRCLQEVVYRYHLMGDTELGYKRAMEIRQSIEVFPIDQDVLGKMEELMELYPKHPPRELLHSSVMLLQKVRFIICSPESHYHEIEEVNSVSPISKASQRI